MLINESNERPKMDVYMKINFSKWKRGLRTERQTYLDNYVTIVKKKKRIISTHQGKKHIQLKLESLKI